MAVADAHGFLEENIIEKVAILFDCLIIHTDKELLQNQKLKDLITKL